MRIQEIAEQLNVLSAGYDIGKLQSIRKEIKALNRRPGNKIFTNDTISDDGWAFHYGGRKELQFNIGFEEEGIRFRYGIAFSLKPSRSLRDVSILYPKILKLNCIIRERPEFFKNYSMWFSLKKNHNLKLIKKQEERSEIRPVTVIPSEKIIPHTFIFIGKVDDSDEINYQNILSTFDELLEIYIDVESNHAPKRDTVENENSFIFNPNNVKLTFNRTYSTKERETNVDIRHSILQEALSNELAAKYGDKNVVIENQFLGNKIDVVLKTNSGFHFYEVKVASSAKACIRQAIGQVLEYAYWPGKKHANKIIIAGEHTLEKESEAYLSFLRNEFHLPIEYKQIKI